MSNELIGFLKQSKESIKHLYNFNNVTVVIGNEACDMDSAVSAIIYGYLLASSATNNTIVIPVLNINYEDYALKTEVTHIFKRIGIFETCLVFRNEINLKVLHEIGKLSLVLVDHNLLNCQDEHLASSISEIVDHHEVLKEFDKKNVSVTIEKVGSCSTLVAEKILQRNAKLMDFNVALLLYATVLVDTVNLSPSAKKTTDKDIKVLLSLKKYLPEIVNDELFQEIQEAKCNMKDLTAEQILRKDVKVINSNSLCIGISSVPISIQEFLEKYNLASALKGFCDKHKYQVLIIMTITVRSQDVQREISIYSGFDSYREQIEDVLESARNPALELEFLDMGISNFSVFNQINVSASRKVLLPLLHKFLLGDDSPMSPMNTVHLNQSFSKLDFNGAFMMLPDVDDNSSETPPLISGSGSSGPYTPHNSYVGSQMGLDSPPQILPSFNSRDMVARIEGKRGHMIGASCEGPLLTANSVPFTPKNSFVDDSAMERYYNSGYNVMDDLQSSQELIEKVRLKKSLMMAPEDEEVSCGSEFRSCSSGHTSAYSQESSSDQRPWTDEDVGNDIPRSAYGFHICDADNEQLTESNKVDKQQQHQQQQRDENVIENNKKASENNNTNHAHVTRDEEKQDLSKSVIDELGYNHADINPVEASTYTTQTVDFPDSPHQLKLLQQKSFEKQAQKVDDYDEDELKAALSPPSNQLDHKKGRPSTLDPLTQPIKRKILVTPDILSSKDDDQKSLSSISNHSETTDMLSPGVDDLMTPDDIDTPDELDESILERFGSLESDTIPEMSAAEEYEKERSWRTCYIAGIERRIDLKVIEPYKKVLSHGGYYSENRNAIILFSACYLPDRARRDYDYVMDNLFLYVLTTLDTLVAEDYILIYLHGATQRSNMPSFGWLKRCYQMIDRRLRKNLKQLFLVHPSFWVKTIVIMTKPFISSKFSKKLKFINNLQELGELIPMDDVCIPDKVKQFDEAKALEEVN